MHEQPTLDAVQQRMYRVLVGIGPAPVTRVAPVAGLGHAEAARVLDELVATGLVVADGPGPTYRRLPPEVALGAVVVRRQESLEAARRLVAELSEEYHAGVRQRDASHLVDVVVGASAMRERLRVLQESAAGEVLWFCRANPLAMQGSDNTEERAALDRGVRYRAVYELALLEGEGELESVLEGVAWGEEARVVDALPVRLAVFDRRTAVCPLTHDGQRDLAEPTAAVIGGGQL